MAPEVENYQRQKEVLLLTILLAAILSSDGEW